MCLGPTPLAQLLNNNNDDDDDDCESETISIAI